MSELERRVQYAEGYYDFGMLADADAELNKLDASLQDHPEVLKIRLRMLMAVKRWEFAARVGLKLCSMIMDDLEVFTRTCECLHQMGKTKEAKEYYLALTGVVPYLRESGVYHYTLSRFEAKLGNLKEAKELAEKAIEMDQSFERVIRADNELKPPLA